VSNLVCEVVCPLTNFEVEAQVVLEITDRNSTPFANFCQARCSSEVGDSLASSIVRLAADSVDEYVLAFRS
jgi:hypothetical protein